MLGLTEKICRICIRTGAPLVDVETVDFDMVRLSEKLEICANLAISEDAISSEICEKCLNKLRVSYHFLDMCKKSTNVLHGYLEKLQYAKNPHFENCDLNVEIEKLPETDLLGGERPTKRTDVNRNEVDISGILDLSDKISVRNYTLRKKQRITKGQRCSLLQQLLNRPKKERDKSTYYNASSYEKGGLKSIIDFTKNYEFSFKLDKISNIKTPLDKLTDFSTNYFRRDFSEFKNHVLYIIENQQSNDCESNFITDDDYLSGSESGNELEYEEVMVEPDIKMKSEESDYEYEDFDSQCPLDYLETSFEEDDVKVKNEVYSDSENDDKTSVTSFHRTSLLKDGDLALPEGLDLSNKEPHGTTLVNSKDCLSTNSSPSVKLLDRLVASYPIVSRKVFSPSNVRCRTRDQPYINPLLKNQFLYRSFKCERCNRYFKSQGYLKAHTSKVH